MLNPLKIGLLNLVFTKGMILLTISSLKVTFFASMGGVIFMLKITIFVTFLRLA
jgi:hypothetical protein